MYKLDTLLQTIVVDFFIINTGFSLLLTIKNKIHTFKNVIIEHMYLIIYVLFVYTIVLFQNPMRPSAGRADLDVLNVSLTLSKFTLFASCFLMVKARERTLSYLFFSFCVYPKQNRIFCVYAYKQIYCNYIMFSRTSLAIERNKHRIYNTFKLGIIKFSNNKIKINIIITLVFNNVVLKIITEITNFKKQSPYFILCSRECILGYR